MIFNYLMKIFDCFTFNDENSVLEIRLNEMSEYIDHFIIVEFGENHQGNQKGKKINEKILEKFKEKIRYIYVEKFNKGMSSWEKENFQRNYIENGLYDADQNDIIIISDLDEIPNLKKINLSNIGNSIYAFKQINLMYKFNLARDFNWIGTKLCKLKRLKSPQWLRSLKVHKKYSYLRIDKIFSNNYVHDFKIIENGGWHFGWIREIDEIINKLSSFAHEEFNNSKFKNYKYIDNCINNNINFLDTREKLEKININLLPKYLISNMDKFKYFFK